MLYDTLSVNDAGHLCFAGQDTVSLAAQYGTPAYILDEATLRSNCRTYTQAFAAAFPEGSKPYYASKALCLRALYPILAEEGFGADVVSAGEMRTALSAGFPADRLCFHGNGKTPADIRMGVEQGVGLFVVDNETELSQLSRIAGALGKTQKVLLRLTPGIDPHTFAAVNTGKIDCQFGMAIETGQARAFVESALRTSHIQVQGYHCHIGSQIFEQTPFVDAARILMDFSAQIRDSVGYVPSVLNIGGGFGVPYVESDPRVDIAACIQSISQEIQAMCAKRHLPMPLICMEPGRSIVANACLTLYTVSSLKEILGHRKYAVVDGGMSDNPRYALYGAKYTVIAANKADQPLTDCYTIAGRCCESGAILQENVSLPPLAPGDLLAVLTTGAYNYSMASNYNNITRSPVVLLQNGTSRLIVRRQTWEEMTACEIL